MWHGLPDFHKIISICWITSMPWFIQTHKNTHSIWDCSGSSRHAITHLGVGQRTPLQCIAIINSNVHLQLIRYAIYIRVCFVLFCFFQPEVLVLHVSQSLETYPCSSSNVFSSIFHVRFNKASGLLCKWNVNTVILNESV